MRALPLAVGLVAVAGSSACVISVDANAYIERSEQRFDAPSVVELHLTTFDGSIEVRSWDRPEVLVTVERRGQTKGAVSHIDVRADRKDRRIDVEATHQGSRGVSFGLTAPSAKLIATVPAKTDLVVRTDDGSVLVDHVDGRIQIHSGDGSIK